MKDKNLDNVSERNLLEILNYMECQKELSICYPSDRMSFIEEMAQIREYIEVAGEYSLAYECIIANLEEIPFKLSGECAVRLLELGLVMGFKTELEQDKLFDMRNHK